MKTCCKCKQTLPPMAFNKSCKRKDGLSTYCKECNKSYHKEHYEDNKASYIKDNRSRINKTKEWIVEYKTSRGCSQCGEKHPACLQFHHLDASSKIDDVSKLVAEGRSKQSILTEIDKCIILCANCHCKEHWNMAH